LRYWWVNQNQTYRQEAKGAYLWSPKRNVNGARFSQWPTELMQQIEDSLAVPSFSDLPRTIIRGIAFCLAESPKQENHFEPPRPTTAVSGTPGSHCPRKGFDQGFRTSCI
jgi:putative restriction endonuclease